MNTHTFVRPYHAINTDYPIPEQLEDPWAEDEDFDAIADMVRATPILQNNAERNRHGNAG